jgi:putative endonuclease
MPGEDLAILLELARSAQRDAIRRRKRRLAAAARPQKPQGPAPSRPPTQAQRDGLRAETQARHWLERSGLRIVAQNLRCAVGEIDLVGLDGTVLVFIEVRHRRSPEYGGAAASVNRQKQQRLIRAANYFLPGLSRRHFGRGAPACRFDVVTVEPTGLHWYRNAFAEA